MVRLGYGVGHIFIPLVAMELVKLFKRICQKGKN